MTIGEYPEKSGVARVNMSRNTSEERERIERWTLKAISSAINTMLPSSYQMSSDWRTVGDEEGEGVVMCFDTRREQYSKQCSIHIGSSMSRSV